MRQKLIGNNLMLIGKIGVTLRLIKTASVGMCVLDLRKLLILPPYPGCRENNSPFVPVFPLYFLQTYDFTLKVFWLSIPTHLARSCKLSRPYLVRVPKCWTWNKSPPPPPPPPPTSLPLKKEAFSGEIFIKPRLW